MFGKKKVQQPTIPPTPIAGGQPAAAAQAPATANPAIASKKPPINAKTNESLKQGSVSVVDIIAPSSVEVDFKHIRVGETFYRTFFVVDYPRQVSPNWLSILIDYKETMNISMFIYPVESKDVLSNLRRKIAEMEATIETDTEQGIEPDPKIRASLEDAIALREELARGLERFYQFGLYVTLASTDVEDLNLRSKELISLLASNLLVVKPATLQMEDGFKSTLPMGVDKLFSTRNMDTTSVASTFPFTSYELSHPNGILYGVNTLNNSLVIVDRFSLENANSVVFGKSGSGKSFLVKLEVLRQMMFETEVMIIDPEDEYRTLCESLGGEYISFSKDSAIKINPFALLPDDQSEAQLGTKILSVHGLLKTMMGEMTATQEAILDRSIVLAYKQKGITPDPSTYKLEPPILEDLYKTLLNMEEPDAKELAFRLEKYVKGGFSGLFNHQTNYDVKNQLTVFSLRQLEDVLRPIAMHVILDFIWTRVRTKMKKRLLIVDEAWYMMRYPDSAAFLQGIAKRCRKYFLGLTTLTQDIEDFLSSDYGKAILSSSSVQILLKQGSSEVETLAKTLNLSEGEKQYLLTAQVGEGLLFAGQNHVTAQFVASQFEYDLVTSKPQDALAAEAQNPPPPPPPPTIDPFATPAPAMPQQTTIQPGPTEIPTFVPPAMQPPPIGNQPPQPMPQMQAPGPLTPPSMSGTIPPVQPQTTIQKPQETTT
jgi:type IV secretory pathway VirB4 component